MNILQTIKCKIGSHQWSEWKYQAPDSCEQVRICNRCQTKETRQHSHTWGNWTDNKTHSKKLRICARCKAEESKELKMGANPAKIKTVYSFVAATIMLDLKTTMGKAMVQQIFPFACQNLRKGNPEFSRLYSQVERENTPHVQGTGMSASVEGQGEAFLHWIKSKGVDIHDAEKKRKICIFGGNAQNPQNGLSFAWGVLIYFDLEA